VCAASITKLLQLRAVHIMPYIPSFLQSFSKTIVKVAENLGQYAVWYCDALYNASCLCRLWWTDSSAICTKYPARLSCCWGLHCRTVVHHFDFSSGIASWQLEADVCEINILTLSDSYRKPEPNVNPRLSQNHTPYHDSQFSPRRLRNKPRLCNNM